MASVFAPASAFVSSFADASGATLAGVGCAAGPADADGLCSASASVCSSAFADAFGVSLAGVGSAAGTVDANGVVQLLPHVALLLLLLLVPLV